LDNKEAPNVVMKEKVYSKKENISAFICEAYNFKLMGL
jgi:hypothetical protein